MWDHRNRGWNRDFWPEDLLWQIPCMIAVTCKYRACEFVCWQTSGATAEHCYAFLPVRKMKATGQLRNTAKNTLLSFTDHATLCKMLCFLHPEPRSSGSGIFQNTSMEPTYHPDPSLVKMPNDTREGCEARPPWEGLHKPMFANHRVSFLNSAIS